MVGPTRGRYAAVWDPLSDKNLDYWMDHLSFKIKLSYFTSQNIYHTTSIVRSFRKKEEEMRIVYRQALG
ncbi:hypothetical protein BRADI_1g52285v3 [Brachypodium distachyon]|uniref:Uncharacterized protein n=1 Tax=Brachypodium distachyon TaxID=15368 RepID=A0A2K2DR22_BRADI|nr:hypothetical protein BRADI_1g52285v3 [Brachypodium distachyon]